MQYFGMGGWLDLTQQGLHPARNIKLLGALALKVTKLLTWHPFPIYLI